MLGPGSELFFWFSGRGCCPAIGALASLFWIVLSMIRPIDMPVAPRYRPRQFHDLSKEFAVVRMRIRLGFAIASLLAATAPGMAVAQDGAVVSLEALRAAEAEARDAARVAWDAAEAADEARDAAAAELERLTAEARTARQAAQAAIATLSGAIGARQAAESDPDIVAAEAARLAAEEAARLAAEEEAARIAAEEEAARLAAEEAARRAEEEAARRPPRRKRRALPRKKPPALPRKKAARLAEEAAAAPRRRRRPHAWPPAQAALDRCLAVAGPPSARSRSRRTRSGCSSARWPRHVPIAPRPRANCRMRAARCSIWAPSRRSRVSTARPCAFTNAPPRPGNPPR
jgi:hypothetical protein